MSGAGARREQDSWTPAMAIARKLRELDADRAHARAMQRLVAAEQRRLRENEPPPQAPPAAPHCPWCGTPLRAGSSSCTAHADLDRLQLGHVTKQR